MPEGERLTVQRCNAREVLPPFTWSVTPTLPDGLSLNPATGEITRQPRASDGTENLQTFTFTVQDSSTPTPQTASKPLDLTIDPP